MKFLQANGFDVQALDAEAILSALRAEMTRGLAEPSELPMLPAGFLLKQHPPRNITLPAFDVGGTNTRSARIAFDAAGNPSIQNLCRGRMPGSQGAVNHEAFYQQLCEVLVQNIRANESLGYCFSYPAKPDGELLFWTKNIQAPEEVGRNVVTDLHDALEARGVQGCSIRMLNDTVAALLAAYAHGDDEPRAGYVGFILGTGVNVSYAEATQNILKCPNLPQGFMPINCESGNFTSFPRSAFDERHEAYNGTGHSLWERCISGVNLGELGTEMLHAAAEENLFSQGLNETLRGRRYTTVELDNFCSGQETSLFPCSATEAETLCTIIRQLYHRAALFAAINIAAAALQSAQARQMSTGKIRINVDGSTFWKAQAIPFVETVRQHLDTLLNPRGFTYEIVKIEDAPLIGAAIAAF